MKKLTKIFLLLSVIVIASCCAVACGNKEVKEISVTFVDEAFQPEVEMNLDFDVLDILETIDEEYTYTLKECFYLDTTLARTDIAYEGTVFNTPAPYDVYITLEVADKNGQKKEYEMTLPVIIPQDEVQEAWMNSWCDVGVGHMMTAMPEHLIEGKKSSVKISYAGTWNPPAYNGVAIGTFSGQNNNTTWENAVIVLKVKNISNYPLDFGMQCSKNREFYVPKYGIHELVYSNCPHYTLPVGEWTEIAFSLRNLGIDYDLMADNAAFGFKVRISDDTGIEPPYSWQLVIAESEVVDYSKERFPDLDTTKPKFLPMDKVQEAWMRSWADGGVTKEMTDDPSHLTDGKETAVKVSYSGDWEAPIYNGLNIGHFGVEGRETTWENAVISLKVKNISDVPLTFGMNWGQGKNAWYVPRNGKTELTFATSPQFQLPVNEWVDIAISLRNLGIDYDLSEDNANFGFKVRITDYSTLTAPYNWSLIIAESKVVDYSVDLFPELDTTMPLVPQNEIQEAWLVSSCTDCDGHVYKELSNNLEYLPEGSESVVKIHYTGGFGGWNPVDDGVDIGYLGTDAVENFGATGINTTWENAVLVINIKNLSTSTLQIGMSISTSTSGNINNGAITPAKGNKALTFTNCPKTSLPGGEWTQVAISLRSLGIDYNIFEDGTRMYFMVRNETGWASNGWDIVIGETKIVDYSADLFPDLVTDLPAK